MSQIRHGKPSFFYEQEFYVLSNFSAFCIKWRGHLFHTSEEVYHYEKFREHPSIQSLIRNAMSAHEALKIAEKYKEYISKDWYKIRVKVMKDILIEKVFQHEYVKRKLLETGSNRELIEDSWRDDFWGFGPNKDGKNMLGKIWMEIRNELSVLDDKTKSTSTD